MPCDSFGPLSSGILRIFAISESSCIKCHRGTKPRIWILSKGQGQSEGFPGPQGLESALAQRSVSKTWHGMIPWNWQESCLSLEMSCWRPAWSIFTGMRSVYPSGDGRRWQSALAKLLLVSVSDCIRLYQIISLFSIQWYHVISSALGKEIRGTHDYPCEARGRWKAARRVAIGSGDSRSLARFEYVWNLLLESVGICGLPPLADQWEALGFIPQLGGFERIVWCFNQNESEGLQLTHLETSWNILKHLEMSCGHASLQGCSGCCRGRHADWLLVWMEIDVWSPTRDVPQPKRLGSGSCGVVEAVVGPPSRTW